MNIALCSPNKDVYSETFIQAHKKYLKGEIYYYYGGELPDSLEGGIVINSRRRRILDIFKGYLHLNDFSLAEQALIKSFKKNQIQVVLAEYGPVGTRLVPICKALGLPLIVHFHGFDASRMETLRVNSNYREIFKNATSIIAVSRKMYQDLLSLGCPEEKLLYNPYGPRPEFQKIQSGFSKQQFIAAGRFVDKKAPYYLILSFQEVLKKFPKARLIIAGDGKLYNTCRNLIELYNLKDNVILPGVLSKKELCAYFKDSLAFVQHSITALDGDTEGTPLSVLEASLAGLPVISTFHAGISDVVEDGVSGYLVKEHDVKGMAGNMIRLLDDPDKAKEIGACGRKKVIDQFSLERHISLIDQTLEKALNP